MYTINGMGCLPPSELGGLGSKLKKAIKKVVKVNADFITGGAVSAAQKNPTAARTVTQIAAVVPSPIQPFAAAVAAADAAVQARRQAEASIPVLPPKAVGSGDAAGAYLQTIVPAGPSIVERFVQVAPGPDDPTKKLMLYGIGTAVALAVALRLSARRR